jgi:hypothetical protein
MSQVTCAATPNVYVWCPGGSPDGSGSSSSKKKKSSSSIPIIVGVLCALVFVALIIFFVRRKNDPKEEGYHDSKLGESLLDNDGLEMGTVPPPESVPARNTSSGAYRSSGSSESAGGNSYAASAASASTTMEAVVLDYVLHGANVTAKTAPESSETTGGTLNNGASFSVDQRVTITNALPNGQDQVWLRLAATNLPPLNQGWVLSKHPKTGMSLCTVVPAASSSASSPGSFSDSAPGVRMVNSQGFNYPATRAVAVAVAANYPAPVAVVNPEAEAEAALLNMQMQIEELKEQLKNKEGSINELSSDKQKLSEPSQAELEKQQQEEAEMAELREFWTILLRGLVVMKYATTGSKPQDRVLWLDRSGERLYLDVEKRFDSKGNEKGLYLRDISQVRSGCNTQTFLKARAHAPPTEKCFSLIGTERTLDMEMPTAFVRDRLVAKFNLLLKALSRVSPRKVTGEDASLLNQFQEVLIRGMEVYAHTSSSFSQHKTTKNVLWLGDGVNVNGETAARLYLANKKRKTSKGAEKGLWLEDIAECRPGINSDGFFKAPDNMMQAVANKCFSVIGSECTLDLEVDSGEARNAVVHRFQLWLQQIAQSNPRHFSNQ